MNQPAQKDSDSRFLFIDGLRGIAAMAVVFYHLYGNLEESVRQWFPPLLGAAFHHGNLGVDVFFVLSGFVIPHSVKNGKFGLSYLARYGLRRSIRLDPPLWATIILELFLVRMGLYFYPDLGSKMPGWREILANITYLQELLKIDNVIAVFWSLTYEVQFYIIIVSCFVLLSWATRTGHFARKGRVMLYGVVTAVFLYSVAIYHGVLPDPLYGLFVIRWFEFFLGVLAWGVVTGKIKLRYFVIAFVVAIGSAVVNAEVPYRLWSTVAAACTGALIIWAGLKGKLSTLLRGRSWQFLGRISYSLYLLHTPIGWRFISLCKKVLGEPFSILTGTAVLAGGVGVSILSAWLMYVLIEAPSVRLAKRVHLPKQTEPVAQTLSG